MIKFNPDLSVKKLIVLILLLAYIVSCSVDYRAEVESNTSWSGAFGNKTVDGSGNNTIDLKDEHPVCCCVQKETKEGYLRVRIAADGGGIFGTDDSDWVETTAEYGVVTVCSEE